jgi:hypothetical protein
MRSFAFSSLVVVGLLGSVVSRDAAADGAPRELLDEGKALLVVGACAEGTAPNVKPAIVAAHCKQVKAAQADYRKGWLTAARTFFAANVPATIPKVVVYPFAGGDLSTALTVFPDAEEITTLSLEPAGDPLTLGKLPDAKLKTALATVATELRSLYRSNFSVTMNMITAMRGGQLPTQLIFSLSAIAMHERELVSLRYFTLSEAGDIEYLTVEDVAALEKLKDVGKRNRGFGNVEIKFKKPGGKDQTYRHVMANLDDAHLKTTPAALAHLKKKGKVAGMTKAASYLLTFDQFKTMRQYVIDHVEWMVSDSTGLPPKYGTPAGFEYETHGTFESSNMPAGGPVTPQWKQLFASQPRRKLDFRFGYPDGKFRGHLVIMRRAGT